MKSWACGAARPAGVDFLAQCREAGRAQEETRFGPEVVAAADAMSSNEFTATVNDRCRMCAVKGLCPIQPQGRSVIDQ